MCVADPSACMIPKLPGSSDFLHFKVFCTCRYWEIDREGRCTQNKRPYRIELVGVTCDAGLAVARGVWRKLRSALFSLYAPMLSQNFAARHLQGPPAVIEGNLLLVPERRWAAGMRDLRPHAAHRVATSKRFV